MIYLDHNATTVIDLRVKEFIISLMDTELNPSSAHSSGRFAKNIIEIARSQIAMALGITLSSREYDITFTSSGTESNNLIMKNFYDGDIFISAIEHLSIYNHIKHAPNIKIIKVDNRGLVDLKHLEELLSQSSTAKKLVSVMIANNESGVIQDIAEISKITKKYEAKFHSDLIQSLGKIPINIKELGLDFATISGHKIGAGQGSSALISNSNFHVTPMIIGGGQEKGVRSGTENVLAIAGLGLAAELVTKDISEKYIKIKSLQETLEKKLKKYPNVNIISENVSRLPNTSLFTVPGTDAQIKLIGFDLRNICVSSGSACSSGKISKSHVLTNMGVEEEEAKSSIRVSLSHNNTLEDIEAFIKAFEEIYDWTMSFL
ncbi:MAG: cysteine desulfurase family protein [Rickettsia endosymbiont of Ixodes persulcatus]|nr:cysteine desulfurase family protein [Rickettsia endosymbiont of Ixodes persulcatus]MCZ6903443.1 cysteine desulfurase family protein [Rickettsia endosymbiont of Ixodes persulcatus]MCZ6908458.1 cysteine desulfurase family protein [Rickettsia endosymbiont of Ixodes persulcatus]MCZ6909734.1 cysteine desulfurase family protein [Rickettsia endosymbiont of Ixodes persulcatus]MCZ6913087.1 cysteine desulfurase family protein [Rickettsia endosymbiont of Ixodes persulcatus]